MRCARPSWAEAWMRTWSWRSLCNMTVYLRSQHRRAAAKKTRETRSESDGRTAIHNMTHVKRRLFSWPRACSRYFDTFQDHPRALRNVNLYIGCVSPANKPGLKLKQPACQRQSGRQSQIHVVTRSHRAVGDTVGDKVWDKAKSMSWQDLTEQWETQWETKWETQWETKWETKPDPCRDKISQSSGRQSGRHSQIHVVTRSHRAVGDTVGDKARSMSWQDLTEQWETKWGTKWRTK